MANFRYQIIDSKGKMSEGIIEAATIGEASRKLKHAEVHFTAFPGGHEWQPWRKSIHEFVQMIFK